MDFLNLCKKIIRIDSTPRIGNEEIALFCADLCREYGMDVALQEGQLNGLKQFNLLARPLGSSRKGEVIFQTHLDTVETGPMGNWTKTDLNPFKATVDGDKIYGLGSADVKLDFLCKLRALKDFVTTPQKRPFVLVGTYREEVGMVGAQHIMKSKAVDADMAIIGEPSELQIVYANNGYLVIDYYFPFSQAELAYRGGLPESSTLTQEKVFHGRAAHSSTPHLGDSALLKLIEYISKLPKGVMILEARGGSSVNTVPADANVEIDANHTLAEATVGERLVAMVREIQKLEKEFLNFEDKNFSPSHPTANVGMLRTKADGLHMMASFRITPQIKDSQVQSWIKTMQVKADALAVRCEPQRFSPPAFTSLTSDLVEGALAVSKKLGLSTKPITKASGTECSVYTNYGLDCIVFGPGISIGNSHTANEYNFLSQLDKATEFYVEIIKRFCL